MFNSPHKKRAPMSQLRYAAQTAFGMLKSRGVVREHNVLEELAKDSNAPILPGVPSYLPHRWTIEAAQSAMFVLIKEWVKKTNDDLIKQDNVSDFFKFVIMKMQDEERKYKREVRKTGKLIKEMKETPLLSDIFSPLRKSQTIQSMHKFFVDSFAISVIVHANGSTGDYVDWFLNEWTPSLYKLWSTKKHDTRSD